MSGARSLRPVHRHLSTYVLLGDERDSPRGRIYLMKDMLEKGADASPQVQHHVDRSLSCLLHDYLSGRLRGAPCISSISHAPTSRRRQARLARASCAACSPRPFLIPERFRRAVLLAPLGRPFTGLLHVSASRRSRP